MAQVLVSSETQAKIKQLLQQKAKTPCPLTVEDVLKKIRPSVRKMLRKGHSLEDVNSALTECNLNLPLAVIKTVYAPQKGAEKGNRKSQKRLSQELPALADPISQKQLDEIVTCFQQLAQTRKGKTLQELVASLVAEIDEDLQAGWDYEDIAQWLADDFNVKIAVSSLKRYHTDSKRKAKPVAQPSSKPAGEPKPAVSDQRPAAKHPRRLQEPSAALKTTFAGEFNL